MEARRQDKLAKTGEELAQPKKKPYATPRLVSYGNIAQLTSGKFGGKPSGVGDEEEFSGAIVEPSAPA